MDQEKEKKLSENTRRLILPSTSDELFKQSIVMIKPSGRRVTLLFILSVLIFSFYHFFIMRNNNSNVIASYRELLVDVNEIIIPTFAVIITGYAIFQALANGSTLITLVTVNAQEKSKFEEYNLYFLGISLLYLFITVFNLAMMFIFKNISEDWHLKFFSQSINEWLASFLVTIYLLFIINALIELKSFIYNLYQCFNINAASTAIDYIKENNKKKEN